ncbi:unnamed protein product [Adineta ricciae]|uniref:CCHC-type domain-containing protein n=1 Tax=Adineta ricciae TaxID=249248 RepID=A0A815QCR7_ADIRI|nr:unnamed protein product [Adineta ricciae]
MAKMNYKSCLKKLLDNEFSISSNDKNRFISGYKSLIDILQVPEISKQLHGCHDLLFDCISQIILTPFNHDFDDEQLRALLELASNARVLTMSQNQIIDGWLQNVEDRIFEKPDDNDDEEEDDDDDLYEDASESEEEEVKDIYKKLHQDGRNQRQQKHVTFVESSSMAAKGKTSSSTQILSNQRNGHVAHIRDQQNGHRNDIPGKSNPKVNKMQKESDSIRGKGRRVAPFDNKYGVDLRKYDCYLCGEYGHVQYDCPQKPKSTARGNARGNNRNKTERKRSNSSSSSSSTEPTTINEADHNRVQHLYNISSKLLNSSQSADERTQTFELFLSLTKKLQDCHGTNLLKTFQDKESTFYPLFCHIAQNDFLFTNEQYQKIYELRTVLLPTKSNCLNADRSIFCAQRQLMALTVIEKHLTNATQMQPTIFNDFQEYIIRSTPPISPNLYDLIRNVLRSSIYIDKQYLDNFTARILFEKKKDIFSTEQLQEFHSCLDMRMKRFERNNQKQVWKERLNSFKNDQFIGDLNQWLTEFEQILKSDSVDVKPTSTIIVDHAMWYFAILFMSSSGHLSREQFDNLLKSAIQSSLFNAKQKFYFEFYLNQGHAPIMFSELKQIKAKLEADNQEGKHAAYEDILKVLERLKPEFHVAQENEQTSTKTDDTIPIIDNHVLLYLISLIEIICSDTKAFSDEQCKNLLDNFLDRSSIVRPLSNIEQQRIKTFYKRPMSLYEMKKLCTSSQFDVEQLVSIVQNQNFLTNEEILDYLTQNIVEIFANRRKFSREKCEELKSLIDKKTFGKQRCRLINESFDKHRSHRNILPLIDPTILNQLLTKIFEKDHQAHLQFFTLLEDFSQRTDFDEMTIQFEINRCLFSSIILVICENNFSNESNPHFYRQHLKAIIEKQSEFFAYLFTEQQYKFVLSRLPSSSNLDRLIESIKNKFNEDTYEKLIHLVENDLREKSDMDKLFNFILSTFDNQCLTIAQTLQLANRTIELSKTLKNSLQFLVDLLQQNLHVSPKNLLNSIETHQSTDQTRHQIIIILKTPNAKYAIADWKKTMIRIITILHDQNNNNQQWQNIAQQSTMFHAPIFRQQLDLCFNHQSDENKEPSTVRKSTGKIDQSVAHREMFRRLESDDPAMYTIVVEKLHSCLVNKQLSGEISLQKFIQALQTVFMKTRKFSQISLDEWATLIENNRRKIFATDDQCDQLLMNILCARLNLPIDTLSSLSRLIQSKKAHERHDGLQKLILILQNTPLTNKKTLWDNLPTISNPLYDIVTRVIFDEKYNNNQVRQCLTAAKKTCLFNVEHRKKLNEIP